MSDIDDEIRSRTLAFAKDLTVLVRRAAIEAAAAALGARAEARMHEVETIRRGRPPGRRGRAAQVAPRRPAARRRRGEKRPPEELARLTERLGDYIESHPGLRMEAIGKALGQPTRDLNLPIKKLMAAHRIRSEGQKRATEYYPM